MTALIRSQNVGWHAAQSRLMRALTCTGSRRRARTRLTGFLTAAAQARNKWVLVITGKGRAGDGVLRREVPLWIGQPPLDRLVIAYEPAAAAHGGDGALYLRLRAKSGARG